MDNTKMYTVYGNCKHEKFWESMPATDANDAREQSILKPSQIRTVLMGEDPLKWGYTY